jgi:hypothetical protein
VNLAETRYTLGVKKKYFGLHKNLLVIWHVSLAKTEPKFDLPKQNKSNADGLIPRYMHEATI